MSRISSPDRSALWPLNASFVAALLLAAGSAMASSPTLSFQPSGTPSTVSDSAPNVPALQDVIDRTTPTWTVQLLPAVWFLAPSGKLSLPVAGGSGGAFSTEGDKIRINAVDIDKTRLRPLGELHIASEKWRFSFMGSDYSIDRSGIVPETSARLGSVAFTPADRLKLEFSLGSYEVTGGYRLWSRDFQAQSTRPDEGVNVVLGLYGLAGARIYDFEASVERITGPLARSSADNLFIEPVIGARLEAQLADDFSVDVQVSGGTLPVGDSSSTSLDIIASFQYQPTPNFGIRLGYRQLAVSLENGKGLEKFEYNGRIAGLLFGVVLRF